MTYVPPPNSPSTFVSNANYADQISSLQSSIDGIMSDIQGLLAKIAALQPPQMGTGENAQEEYNRAMAEYQQKLADLNQQIRFLELKAESTQRQIEQLKQKEQQALARVRHQTDQMTEQRRVMEERIRQLEEMSRQVEDARRQFEQQLEINVGTQGLTTDYETNRMRYDWEDEAYDVRTIVLQELGVCPAPGNEYESWWNPEAWNAGLTVGETEPDPDVPIVPVGDQEWTVEAEAALLGNFPPDLRSAYSAQLATVEDPAQRAALLSTLAARVEVPEAETDAYDGRLAAYQLDEAIRGGTGHDESFDIMNVLRDKTPDQIQVIANEYAAWVEPGTVRTPEQALTFLSDQINSNVNDVIDVNPTMEAYIEGLVNGIPEGVDPAVAVQARQVYEAMAINGTDEAALVNMFQTMSDEAVRNVAAAYPQLFDGQQLADHLGEVGGSLETYLVGLANGKVHEIDESPETLARLLENAMNVPGGTDEAAIMNILRNRSSEELAAIGEHYNGDLAAKIYSELNSDDLFDGNWADQNNAMANFAQAAFAGTTSVSGDVPAPGDPGYDAYVVAYGLNVAMKGGPGTQNTQLFDMLQGRTESEMENIAQTYWDQYGDGTEIADGTTYRDYLAGVVGDEFNDFTITMKSYAQALVQGLPADVDPTVGAAAQQIREMVQPWIFDGLSQEEFSAQLIDILEGVPAAQRGDLVSTYNTLFNDDLLDNIYGNDVQGLGGATEAYALALLNPTAVGSPEGADFDAAAAAAELQGLIQQSGTPELAIFDVLRNKTPEQLQEIAERYTSFSGGQELFAALSGEFEAYDLAINTENSYRSSLASTYLESFFPQSEEALAAQQALADENMEAVIAARTLFESMMFTPATDWARVGADNNAAVMSLLQGMDADQLAATEAAFSTLFDEELESAIQDRVGHGLTSQTAIRDRALELLAQARGLDPGTLAATPGASSSLLAQVAPDQQQQLADIAALDSDAYQDLLTLLEANSRVGSFGPAELISSAHAVVSEYEIYLSDHMSPYEREAVERPDGHPVMFGNVEEQVQHYQQAALNHFLENVDLTDPRGYMPGTNFSGPIPEALQAWADQAGDDRDELALISTLAPMLRPQDEPWVTWLANNAMAEPPEDMPPYEQFVADLISARTSWEPETILAGEGLSQQQSAVAAIVESHGGSPLGMALAMLRFSNEPQFFAQGMEPGDNALYARLLREEERLAESAALTGNPAVPAEAPIQLEPSYLVENTDQLMSVYQAIVANAQSGQPFTPEQMEVAEGLIAYYVEQAELMAAADEMSAEGAAAYALARQAWVDVSEMNYHPEVAALELMEVVDPVLFDELGLLDMKWDLEDYSISADFDALLAEWDQNTAEWDALMGSLMVE